MFEDYIIKYQYQIIYIIKYRYLRVNFILTILYSLNLSTKTKLVRLHNKN